VVSRGRLGSYNLRYRCRGKEGQREESSICTVRTEPHDKRKSHRARLYQEGLGKKGQVSFSTIIKPDPSTFQNRPKERNGRDQKLAHRLASNKGRLASEKTVRRWT